MFMFFIDSKVLGSFVRECGFDHSCVVLFSVVFINKPFHIEEIFLVFHNYIFSSPSHCENHRFVN